MSDRLLGTGSVEPAAGEGGQTRADLLRRAAVTGGALVGGTTLLAGLPGRALAGNGMRASDATLLNYALTLEHLEATFYTQGLRKFGRSAFRTSSLFAGLGDLRGEVRGNFVRIREHEQTHVDALKATIKKLGKTPVPACEYNFETTAFTSLESFVAVAQVLENTGVMAYIGAIAYLDRAPLTTTGARIATVEARHAAYLNLLNGDVPFPDAFDSGSAPRDVCKLVKDTFIVSCPFDLDAFCKTLPNDVVGQPPPPSR
jgi:Ferritin-like domain